MNAQPRAEDFQQPTRVQILAYHNYAIDGIIGLLNKQPGTFDVRCVEPETFALIGGPMDADVMMIHEDAAPDSMEAYLENLTADYPDARILIFGHTCDETYLYKLVCAGAHGCITDNMNGEDMVRAIKEVANGGTWISRNIMQRFITTTSDVNQIIQQQCNSNALSLASRLTKRETEILCKVLEGLRTKEIATQVNLSHQGVKVHLGKLFRKFQVNSRSQLILSALNQVSPMESIFESVRDTLEGHHTRETGRATAN